MIEVKRVDHVAVAVKAISDLLPFYGLLGLRAAGVEEVPQQGVRVALLPAGEGQIELLEPTATDGAVAAFLERRGEGIHHLCLAVEDLEGAIQQLLEAGVEMIDRTPRPGAQGRRVAFIHPRSTHGVLIELTED